MQIKSKMLLPAEEGQDDVPQEDPRQELVKRLLEYERFKEIAQQLKEKEANQQEIFKRPKAIEKEQLVPEAGEVYFEASVFDLLNAFSKALENIPKELFYEVVKDEFTIQDKIHEILHLLLIRNSVHISELFNKAGSKLEIIIIFLAILELIRLKEILARQKEFFGEIVIVRNKDNILPYEKRDKTKTN
jgi:segregation and condensation protein A